LDEDEVIMAGDCGHGLIYGEGRMVMMVNLKYGVGGSWQWWKCNGNCLETAGNGGLA
jgi:hypothetical protein